MTYYLGAFEGSVCDTLEVSSIADVFSRQLKLYPNPAGSSVQIENSIGETIMSVSLFDFSGRLVLSQRYQESGDIELDVSEYPRGIYFLQVKTKAGALFYDKLILEGRE